MIGRISVKSSRVHGHRVTLRIRRDKKRGHDHEMVETTNLKKQVVMRCKVCKHHYIFLYLVLTKLTWQMKNIMWKLIQIVKSSE